MNIRILLIAAIVCFAQAANAANSLPVSSAWNIAPSGDATSSGELHFRMTAGDANPVDITVPIISGAKEANIARYIQRALSSQLRTHRLDVQSGEGANVLVTSSTHTGFSLELVNSDVENVRVAVQSAVPVAPPTVPKQAVPADQQAPATPPAPGDAMPPADAVPPANASQPAAPPPAPPIVTSEEIPPTGVATPPGEPPPKN